MDAEPGFGVDTFALCAKEFPAIKRNCIYYVYSSCNKLHWIYEFHLDILLEKLPYPGTALGRHSQLDAACLVLICPRTPSLKKWVSLEALVFCMH